MNGLFRFRIMRNLCNYMTYLLINKTLVNDVWKNKYKSINLDLHSIGTLLTHLDKLVPSNTEPYSILS